MLLLACLNVIALTSWYLFIAANSAGPLSTRLILSVTGACGQIVVTLTVLGALSLLRPAPVAVGNILISAVVLFAALRPLHSVHGLFHLLQRDVRSLGRTVRAALGWETVLLAIILMFASTWIVLVIARYPPRGIDDVTYHLPPIYQAVQDGSLAQLPVSLRGHFAYPLNGELLFAWVILFTRDIKWIDAPQALFALVCGLAVFALARRFSLRPREAFLASALFATMPVSLLQAPTNYVDLISAAWLLSGVVALLHFAESRSLISLTLAGLAVGLLAGTKASTLPLAGLLAAVGVLAALRGRQPASKRVRCLALFSLPALATSGYWYLRNWIVLGNPIFPWPLRVAGRTIFTGPEKIERNCWSVLLSDPAEAVRIALWDPGLGTFHGGFGFLFWGVALPAFAVQTVRALRGVHGVNADRLLVLSLLPVGLATLFLVSYADLSVYARLVLVAGAPVFIGFAVLIDDSRRALPGAATALRAIAVGSASAGVLLMASARWPLMNLSPLSAGSAPVSEFNYLSRAPWDLRFINAAWTPLDTITRGGAGLVVYQATDWAVFWTAPTFGSQLQNRVWNFTETNSDPQAFLFHSWTGNPAYVRREIRRETVAANQGIRLVASGLNDITTLYVTNEALAQMGRGRRLAEYYRVVAASSVSSTSSSLNHFDRGSVLLAPFPFAAGYLVHEADGMLGAELHPITAGDQDAYNTAWLDRVVFTIGRAVAGRHADIVGKVTADGSEKPIYRNEPRATGPS